MLKMKKLLIYLICLNAAISYEAKASDIVAAGSADIASRMNPLLAVSHDSGSSWNYINNLGIGNLDGVSCVGKFCAVAGDFVAVTQDGGLNWKTATISHAPQPYLQGWFNSISCSSNACVASGIFRYDQARYYDPQPLAAVTQDGGATWFYPQSIYDKSVMPKNFKNAYFTNASCSEKICVAIGPEGDHVLGGNPFLAMSTDKGSTWNYPAAIYSTALPSDFVKGLFYQTSCGDQTCIAVGAYDYKNGSDEKPLLAFTQNAGDNWNYSSSITSALPTNFVGGRLTSAYCNKDLCMASGFYKFEKPNMQHGRPLLAVSRDHGFSWVYPKEIYTTALPKNLLEGAYLGNGISCSKNLCVASGFLRRITGETRPLLAVSKDYGYSWSYPKEIYSTALPRTFVSGAFDGGVVCEGNNCSVAGHFYDRHKEYPLIALTQDGGESWTYPESVYAEENLPKKFGGETAKFLGIA
jgi:hypothetical protein